MGSANPTHRRLFRQQVQSRNYKDHYCCPGDRRAAGAEGNWDHKRFPEDTIFKLQPKQRRREERLGPCRIPEYGAFRNGLLWIAGAAAREVAEDLGEGVGLRPKGNGEPLRSLE